MTGSATPDTTDSNTGSEHVVDTAAETDAVPAAPRHTIPDRADAPVSEVTERFLRAIVADVPLARIEELHLFSPLRQGTVETGIAVFAAMAPVAAPANTLELALEADDSIADLDDTDVDDTDVDDTDVEVIAERVVTDVVATDAVAAEGVEVDAEVDAGVDAEVDALVDSAVDAEVDVVVDAAVDVEVDATVVEDEDATDDASDIIDVEAEVIDTTLDTTLADADSSDTDGADDDADVTIEPHVATPIARHTVYTARYRLVIKGPERGKWEASVVAEAEAPLITVETVVRGVQRRAGEESEIVRYSGAQIAKALRVPLG